MAWNGSGSVSGKVSQTAGTAPKSRGGEASRVRWIVGGALMLVVGVAAFYFFKGSDPSGGVKVVEYEPPPAAVVKAPVAATAKKGSSGGVKVVEYEPPPAKREAVAAPQAVVETPEQAGTNNASKSKRHFECSSDQLIAMVTSIPDGGFIPPLPTVGEHDTDAFIKAYRKPLKIDPGEPEETQRMKRRINEVRDQIAGMIAQNPELSLSEILNAHRDQFNNNSEMSAEAQANYNQLVAEGDAEMAETYRKKVNDFLRQTGAPEVEKDDEEEGEE